MVNKFSLRYATGGKGRFFGGDGLVREYLFRENYNLCILTERRVFQPYGLAGGEPGSKGKNTLVKRDGKCINLCSKSRVDVEPGVK